MKVYNILASGSDGNAILYLDNTILVDVGVPYKTIEPYIKDIHFVFISHIHSDHFNKRTIPRLIKVNPFITFLVGEYLYNDLLELGITKENIHIIEKGITYKLNKDIRDKKYKKIGSEQLCIVSPIMLYHNVDNMGLRIFFNDDKKLIHATDTYTLEGISAKGYDYYMIEENHCEIKIQEAIEQANYSGKFTHAKDSMENHLSIQNRDKWLELNNVNNGVVIGLHRSNSFL